MWQKARSFSHHHIQKTILTNITSFVTSWSLQYMQQTIFWLIEIKDYSYVKVIQNPSRTISVCVVVGGIVDRFETLFLFWFRTTLYEWTKAHYLWSEFYANKKVQKVHYWYIFRQKSLTAKVRTTQFSIGDSEKIVSSAANKVLCYPIL